MQKICKQISALSAVIIVIAGSWFILSDSFSTNKADTSQVSDIVTMPVVDPDQLDSQIEVYLQSVELLVAADTSLSDTQVESFLFETRVPYTFQSEHLTLAQTWGNRGSSFDPAQRASFIAEYYALIQGL
jgi:hypothetical protein